MIHCTNEAITRRCDNESAVNEISKPTHCSYGHILPLLLMLLLPTASGTAPDVNCHCLRSTAVDLINAHDP
jgi:hypothetical protein